MNRYLIAALYVMAGCAVTIPLKAQGCGESLRGERCRLIITNTVKVVSVYLEEEDRVKEFEEIRKVLEKKVLTFSVKTGKDDKVFGMVSTKQISDELKKLGYSIDKKCIKLDHPLDTLGSHLITIELHKRVVFQMKVVLKK